MIVRSSTAWKICLSISLPWRSSLVARVRQSLSRHRRMLEANALKHGFALLLALLAMRLARQIPRVLVILYIPMVSGEDEAKGKVNRLEQTYHRRATSAMDVISGADASDLRLGISRHDYSVLLSSLHGERRELNAKSGRVTAANCIVAR